MASHAFHDESTQANIEVGPLRRDEVRAVAAFHHRWFGPDNELEVEGASLATLGADFLADAFYAANFENPAMHVHVARQSGRIIGFNVFLASRRHVGRHALTRHLPRLLWATLRALITHPAGVLDLLTNVRYLRGEQAPWLHDDDAQWLVFTVDPEFRSPDYVRRTGRRITAELFELMEKELRSLGRPAWYGTVWVSNGPMSRFMERIGAVVIGRAEAQGHLVNYWRKAL